MNQPIERELPRRRSLSPELLLPSRAAALERLHAALLDQDGPLLITGEAGAGKTWLSRRLEARVGYPWRWAYVDVTPATEPAGLLRDIARRVGLPQTTRTSARWAFADALAESAAEGERWALVVEEAHNASDAVWEEIRVLGNHLAAADGFAGIVLVAQTSLARRLGTRALAPLGARLGLHVHLQPLDLEEALRLLDSIAPGWSTTARVREELHRDALGNPRRLAQLVARFPRHADIAESTPEPVGEASAPSNGDRPAPLESRPVFSPPSLVPVKPPLRDEDGVIEVGWDPTDVASNEDAPRPATLLAGKTVPEESEPSEESIDDHYAALQAWSEWANNQGRSATATETEVKRSTAGEVDAAEPADDAAEPAGHANVWAEGQHGFAPYSQLFSRLRQPRDTK